MGSVCSSAERRHCGAAGGWDWGGWDCPASPAPPAASPQRCRGPHRGTGDTLLAPLATSFALFLRAKVPGEGDPVAALTPLSLFQPSFFALTVGRRTDKGVRVVRAPGCAWMHSAPQKSAARRTSSTAHSAAGDAGFHRAQQVTSLRAFPLLLLQQVSCRRTCLGGFFRHLLNDFS